MSTHSKSMRSVSNSAEQLIVNDYFIDTHLNPVCSNPVS